MATGPPPGSSASGSARRWVALAVLMAAMLLLAIDATVLNLAVPSFTKDLSPTSQQTLWIGDVYFWWSSVFLINVPVMAVVLVLGVFLLPESRDPKPGHFDVPSAALSMLRLSGQRRHNCPSAGRDERTNRYWTWNCFDDRHSPVR